MKVHPWQNLVQACRSARGNSNLGFEIGLIIELPIAKVREGRGRMAKEGPTIGEGPMAGGGGGGCRAIHSGELVVLGGVAGGGVGNAAAPLEDEGKGGEGEGKES